MSIKIATDLEPVTCVSCGIVFGVPAHLERRLRETHREFFCPNGHSLSFHGKSESEKLRDQLAAERARLDQARAEAAHQRKQAEVARGQVTRIRNRIGKGVCPCCNRTFENLARHMATKHPEAALTK